MLLAESWLHILCSIDEDDRIKTVDEIFPIIRGRMRDIPNIKFEISHPLMFHFKRLSFDRRMIKTINFKYFRDLTEIVIELHKNADYQFTSLFSNLPRFAVSLKKLEITEHFHILRSDILALVRLKNLEVLKLPHLKFFADELRAVSLLIGISGMTKLRHLDLQSSRFDSSVAKFFEPLTKLETLRLDSSKFVENPQYLTNSPNLTQLNLSSSTFYGWQDNLCGRLSYLTKLRKLHLGCKLYKHHSAEIAKLVRLEKLSFGISSADHLSDICEKLKPLTRLGDLKIMNFLYLKREAWLNFIETDKVPGYSVVSDESSEEIFYDSGEIIGDSDESSEEEWD